MSTLEMIIWLVLWIMMGVLAAGTGWMLLSGQAAHAESESAIAEFEARGDR